MSPPRGTSESALLARNSGAISADSLERVGT